jgi:hypothetical protein
MSELQQVLQHLKQPEYVHVLLNPLPVYATAMGVLALAVALAMRSRPAQIVALIIVILGCGSAWPVIHYGRAGYDRVYSMSYPDAQKWLDVHADRAEDCEAVFYTTAGLSLAAIVLGSKFPKTGMWLTVATLVAAIVCLGLGGWIAHAGGQVRHAEFRHRPPPAGTLHQEHEKD